MTSPKLTPEICYMAGLFSRNRQKEKGAVGILTGIGELEQRFIEIAMREFGIDSRKIVVEEVERGNRHVYFYHSRVSKLLKDIYTREVHLFKKRDKLSANYVGGMFDGGGHVTKTTVSISPISPADALMLQNLGIHTNGNNILNISNFISLVKGSSILLGQKNI